MKFIKMIACCSLVVSCGNPNLSKMVQSETKTSGASASTTDQGRDTTLTAAAQKNAADAAANLAVTASVSNSAPSMTTSSSAPAQNRLTNLTPFKNPSGLAATYSTKGYVDLNNAFFKSLGTNGRTCATCHDPAAGWSIVPDAIQARFNQSNGLDPLFRTNDGAVCANANISTLAARKSAYSLLLNKGLIRVEMPMPSGAEFELVAATGTYCNNPVRDQVLQLFRRPLPSANLKFVAAVMWDGRETIDGAPISQDLSNQANDATVGHAQAVGPISQAQRDEMVDFESSLYTAQIVSNVAGQVTAANGHGGPVEMVRLPFSIGINDTPINPVVFNLYDSWSRYFLNPGQAAIARGQSVFNSKKFRITNVAGQDSQNFVGTCGTCHNTPNVGSYSVPEFFNIGVASASTRTPDLPLYSLRNKSTGAVIQVSDPGRAMVTGKWADIGEFKPATLRGLATHAPYFHNGMAASLEDVVGFYNARFNIGFTAQERADLAAFLKAL